MLIAFQNLEDRLYDQPADEPWKRLWISDKVKQALWTTVDDILHHVGCIKPYK